MRQLDYVRTRVLEWHEAPTPDLPSKEAALVRPVVVSTCDMDGFVIGGGVPFKGPVPVGHEGVAQFLEVGDAVETVRPGDYVSPVEDGLRHVPELPARAHGSLPSATNVAEAAG